MTRKDEVISELTPIIGSYTSGCVICKKSTNDAKIYIYDFCWNHYKMIRLLYELEKL